MKLAQILHLHDPSLLSLFAFLFTLRSRHRRFHIAGPHFEMISILVTEANNLGLHASVLLREDEAARGWQEIVRLFKG